MPLCTFDTRAQLAISRRLGMLLQFHMVNTTISNPDGITYRDPANPQPDDTTESIAFAKRLIVYPDEWPHVAVINCDFAWVSLREIAVRGLGMYFR